MSVSPLLQGRAELAPTLALLSSTRLIHDMSSFCLAVNLADAAASLYTEKPQLFTHPRPARRTHSPDIQLVHRGRETTSCFPLKPADPPMPPVTAGTNAAAASVSLSHVTAARRSEPLTYAVQVLGTPNLEERRQVSHRLSHALRTRPCCICTCRETE